MKVFENSEMTVLSYRIWLSREFTKRCQRNTRYSLRAFSNLLGMEASTVSQILSGKRKISAKMVQKLCNILGAEPSEQEALLRYANQRGVRNKIPLAEQQQIEAKQLTLDAFAIIADWYHYAILELTFVQDFKNSARWIANKLNITTAEASIGIERLIRLGLLVEENGYLIKTEVFITNFSEGVTSEALKKMQRSILKMGLKAIDDTPQMEKDITGITFSVNEERLDEARDLIKKFRRELAMLMGKGKQTRVYQLGIQLYPISKKSKELS